MNKERW